MTVVYIDSVFLFNMLTDYLMLLCAAHLAGIQLRRGRFLLAAAAGRSVCGGGVFARVRLFDGASHQGGGRGAGGCMQQHCP